MSLDVEPHAHSHSHKTGHRWVDMVVAFSALFVSVVSLGVAIVHGRTMEHMAEANARLVDANSWPYLSYGAETVTVNEVPTTNMHVDNGGVGPAKIESAELIWKRVAYRTNQDFLKACCNRAPKSDDFAAYRLLPNRVLRAGESIEFLGFKQDTDPVVFTALQRAMLSRDLHLYVCYCDIFDECWKDDLTKVNLKPLRVPACVQPKIPFDQGVSNQ
jgi:hypothetical protein